MEQFFKNVQRGLDFAGAVASLGETAVNTYKQMFPPQTKAKAAPKKSSGSKSGETKSARK